jgi:hypothetical protein
MEWDRAMLADTSEVITSREVGNPAMALVRRTRSTLAATLKANMANPDLHWTVVMHHDNRPVDLQIPVVDYKVAKPELD